MPVTLVSMDFPKRLEGQVQTCGERVSPVKCFSAKTAPMTNWQDSKAEHQVLRENEFIQQVLSKRLLFARYCGKCAAEPKHLHLLCKIWSVGPQLEVNPHCQAQAEIM